MPFIDPLPFTFAALRRFSVEQGIGEIVAVYFSPAGPRSPEGAEKQPNQARLEQKAGDVPATTGTTNVVTLGPLLRRTPTHG